MTAPPVEVAVPAARRRALIEALCASSAVTALVTIASTTLPDRFVATAVGFVFLAATWALVWRGDDARVVRSGLTLGGLVLPGRIDVRAFLGKVARASGWAALFGAIFFVPFFFGWRAFWHPRGLFALRTPLLDLASDAFGQVVIIAIPEEAFYRGYLQTRLDEALPWQRNVFGARVGPGLLLTSLIFALGHYATVHDPARLAVFFPSLVFGWLRARTGGIGAAVAFHASCNTFSAILGKAYRLY